MVIVLSRLRATTVQHRLVARYYFALRDLRQSMTLSRAVDAVVAAVDVDAVVVEGL